MPRRTRRNTRTRPRQGRLPHSTSPQGVWTRTNATASMVQPRTPIRVTLRVHIAPDTPFDVRVVDLLTQLHLQVNLQVRPCLVVKSVRVRLYTLHPVRLKPWCLDSVRDTVSGSDLPIQIPNAAKFFIPRNLVVPVQAGYHWPIDQSNNVLTLADAEVPILNVEVGKNLEGPEECLMFLNFSIEWWNEAISDPVIFFGSEAGKHLTSQPVASCSNIPKPDLNDSLQLDQGFTEGDLS